MSTRGRKSLRRLMLESDAWKFLGAVIHDAPIGRYGGGYVVVFSVNKIAFAQNLDEVAGVLAREHAKAVSAA